MRVISSRGFSWFPTFGPALCCQHFLCFILRNRSIQMTVVHVSKACGSSCGGGGGADDDDDDHDGDGAGAGGDDDDESCP